MLRLYFDAVFLLCSLWCEYCLVPFGFRFHHRLRNLLLKTTTTKLHSQQNKKHTQKEETIGRRDQNKNIELRKLRTFSVFLFFGIRYRRKKTSAFLVMSVTWHAWHVLAVPEDKTLQRLQRHFMMLLFFVAAHLIQLILHRCSFFPNSVSTQEGELVVQSNSIRPQTKTEPSHSSMVTAWMGDHYGLCAQRFVWSQIPCRPHWSPLDKLIPQDPPCVWTYACRKRMYAQWRCCSPCLEFCVFWKRQNDPACTKTKVSSKCSCVKLDNLQKHIFSGRSKRGTLKQNLLLFQFVLLLF